MNDENDKQADLPLYLIAVEPKPPEGMTLTDARAALMAARREIDRLSTWLYRIEGGDHPCEDAAQLRRWAYEAITLGREVSDG